jgi:hypothetical protein
MVSTSNIERRQLGDETLAYQKFHGTLASVESLTSVVRSWVVTMGLKATGPLAIELEGEPTDDLTRTYDIEVQLPVSGEAQAKVHPSDRVQLKRFEPTAAAILTLHGPHELTKVSEELRRIRAWMDEQNLKPGPRVRWVELTDPTKVALDDQRVELQYLLAS